MPMGMAASGTLGASYNAAMSESHLELREVRCPQCGGDMGLRVFGDERGKDVKRPIEIE